MQTTTTVVETVTVDELGAVTGRSHRTVRCLIEPLAEGLVLELAWVPAGSFLMGSPRGVGYDDERPQRLVRVPSFWLGRVQVTQAQWAAAMDWAPAYRFSGPNRPADRLSWHEASAFCDRLARQTGRPYRLPSEAEWEYACRAGTATPFCFGVTLTPDLANYAAAFSYGRGPTGLYRHETVAVGCFPANAFGLHDMHGNLWEWCADAWHDSYSEAPDDGRPWDGPAGAAGVLRGGCWHDPPDLCRSAARLRSARREGEDFFGMRVALPAPSQ